MTSEAVCNTKVLHLPNQKCSKGGLFSSPLKGHEIAGGWLRVRDEGDKVTTSLKVVNGTQITDQRELMLKIDNFDTAVSFLTSKGASENIVRRVSEKLGFDWSQAIFGSPHLLTARKYGIPEDILNNEIPRIVFDEDNPYLEWQHRHKS
jgi:adenylate cyclase class 2